MSAITSSNSKLGFVGIGYMGWPIAQRLLNSGFRPTAYDRRRAKAEELIRYGGTSRKTSRNFGYVEDPTPKSTTCCRAWRVMKLSSTSTKEQMERLPMRIVVRWSST
jgi:6-phosphogluconate dehydrogenase (decarboxylating)